MEANRRQFLKYLCSGLVLDVVGPYSSTACPIVVNETAKMHWQPEDTHLRILTFNCWALPALFAKDQNQRVTAIAERLSMGEFDVVGLQEVWDGASQTKIARMARRGGLKYSHYFKNGISGSGIMILSRYPILACDFHAYGVNGKPQKLLRDDYYGSKGVGMARISSPAGIFDFYVTHLISHYDKQDEYQAHRAAQVFELLQFMDRTNKTDFLIVAGGLNSTPESLEYCMMTGLEKLNDAYAEVHSDAGYTSNCDDPGGPTRRIDYILYRASGKNNWNLVDSKLSMRFMGNSSRTYSDHFGVTATFSSDPKKTATSHMPVSYGSDRYIVENAIRVIEEGIADARNRESRHFMKAVGSLALFPAGKFFAESLRKSGHSPHLCRLLGLVFSYFMPLVAIVQLSLGLFWVPNELDALKNVRDEMTDALKDQRPAET